MINNTNYFQLDGAPTRTRTADLLITNQLLYQLSYRGASSLLDETISRCKPRNNAVSNLLQNSAF